MIALLMVSTRLWNHFYGEGECAYLASVYASLPQYGFWALATPFIFRLSSNKTLSRWSWQKKVPLFLGVGLVLMCVVGVINGFSHNFFYHPMGEVHSGFTWNWENILGASTPNFMVYLAILSTGFAFCYFKRYRSRQLREARLQSQLAQARLHALQMQIQPHFLFNTLNTVSSLVDRDPESTRRTVARLSEMLRHTLESTDEQTVTLARELQFLKCYIEILEIRFGPRLRFELEIQEKTLHAMVPNLLLQPLVENAIKHGFDRMPKAGMVTIGSSIEGDRLHLWVYDNGRGADPPHMKLGVGLSNLHARLEQLWGDRFQWQIGSGREGGLTVDIRFPLIYLEPDSKAAALSDRRGVAS